MIDLERTVKFCDLVFSALWQAGLLPQELNRPYGEFEKWPLALVRLINARGPEAGFLEWLSDAGHAANGLPESREFFDLGNWIKSNSNTDFFNKSNLLHLKKSIAGRAHTFVFYRQDYIITVAEAERRWKKQTLRTNAKDRLAMWQEKPGSPWLTTTREMEKVFGPEPK